MHRSNPNGQTPSHQSSARSSLSEPYQAVSWLSVLSVSVRVTGGSVLTAPLGTKIAHKISGLALRRIFAGFLLLVGTSLWWGP